jgi:hypothetical protein
MAKKYEWPTIKAEYVEGVINADGNRSWLSLEETAVKFGCSITYIRKRSSREGWLSERHLFVQKVEQARKEKKSDKLAGKSADFDLKCLKIAEAGMSHIAHHLSEAAKKSTALSLTESNLASSALKNFQQVGRLALGDSTEKIDKPGVQVNTQVNLDLSDCTKEEIALALSLGLKIAGPQEDDIR